MEPTKETVTPVVAESSKTRPKLQLSNGYCFDASQIATLLSFVAERPEVKRFARREITEGTGLTERQAESLASMSVAMGLIAANTQVLTDLGRLVVRQDLFFDSPITLEFLHYMGAGTPKNLVWFTVFNDLLYEMKPLDQAGWTALMRQKLAGGYSKGSLIKHVAHEVRFVLDAYTDKSFSKLKLLRQEPGGGWVLDPLLTLQPYSLAAVIYQYAKRFATRLLPYAALHEQAGSPGRVFGLKGPILREMVEGLHQKGWIRFEVRHGLDQVRLVEDFDALSFIEAGYENREPEHRKPKQEAQTTLL